MLLNRLVDDCYKHWTPSAAKLYRIANTGIERSAEGAIVTDHRGKHFIDCACSYGIFLVGHQNPQVKYASQRQLNRMAWQPEGLTHNSQHQLSETLKRLAPGEWGDVRYTMTGAEAIEQTLRYALKRQLPRKRIVVMRNAYHGKTLTTMAILGQQYQSNQHGLNRVMVDFIPYGDFAALEHAITNQVAAVYIEPILGGAHLTLPEAGYNTRIRELCSAHGCLMIADEIQTAFGRCGKWFGVDYDNVVPDIMVLSKGLTGGYAAIAAVMYSRALIDRQPLDPLEDQVCGQGGLPYACETALAAIRAIEEGQLIEKSQAASTQLCQGLQLLAEAYPQIISDAPAIGLMTGLRLKGAVWENLISMELTKRGVHSGHSLNEKATAPVLRFYPPLTITTAQISQVLKALEESLEAVASKPRWMLKLMTPIIRNLYRIPYGMTPRSADQ
ncbi:aspartate aminotransferase family protein [Pseudomonas sp. CVAP|uniref:aspartate aminotransferase family protein n=1 Tax=Pseudomonas sp. CVAP\|nr:aspartate aminotransferase family protein [Pseudomonas sp. CVAP\